MFGEKNEVAVLGAAGVIGPLDGFVDYLREQRGVSPLTISAYVADVDRFLARRSDGRLLELTASEVSEAVLGEMADRSPASVRRYACALRSFLRYCQMAGLVETDLSAAVLPVSGRRRSLLPCGINEAACDRRRAVGRRDYAVIVLLLRLGLRAAEVATLRLDDLDWRAGQIKVHGKGGRVDELPLPVDVGEAITGYLRHGRPRVEVREVFLRVAPPPVGLTRRSLDHRPARQRPRRADTVRRAPAAAHCRQRHAARRGSVGRDRPGSSAPLRGQHGCLRPRRCRTAAHDRAALAERSRIGRGGVMTALAEHLDDYLRMRRALGFELGLHGQVLPSFVAYLEGVGAGTITVELTVGWAQLPERIKPITVSYRLSVARGFARYLHAIDPAHQIAPTGLLWVPRRRPAPYIYSREEIVLLLEETRLLRPPLRAATLETLIGLLAAGGMRVGEALALTRDDVDLSKGLLTIRHTKFDRQRLVPLHPSVTAALRDYSATRDRLCPTPSADRFFLSTRGYVLRREEVECIFRAITVRIGLCTTTTRPRIHDLRHSFAVASLIDWHREGIDVAALLPVLSTYLGHVEPANTYWYLSAVPELMQQAATRLEQHTAGQS